MIDKLIGNAEGLVEELKKDHLEAVFLISVYAGLTLTACGPRLPSVMSNVTD